MELCELGAVEAARGIAQDEFTSEALVRSCLDRIRERDPAVAAWAFLDPAQAIEQARARDRAPGGLLGGVPVGFKDIIDTADMPTAYGSPIYRGHRPVMDAPAVALTRAAGAVLLGKTVTTEFAFRYPGVTRNPHNPLHTPGGSSSGSAAGVADRQVPLAVGTQTGGSVIRPAAYCGTYAVKPTFNAISFAAVRHFAESFDTLGCMARSLDDLALFRAVLQGIEPDSAGQDAPSSPRIGFCRTPYWSDAQDATRRLHEEAAEQLARAGARLVDFDIREDGTRLDQANWAVNKYEGARTLLADFRGHPDRISPAVRDVVQEGLAMPFATYRDAIMLIGRLRNSILSDMADLDAILTPSAVGEAPLGLNNTGPIAFNFIWTITGTPTISLPAFTGPNGLPIGLQLVGRHWEEDRLFAVARWVDRTLRRD